MQEEKKSYNLETVILNSIPQVRQFASSSSAGEVIHNLFHDADVVHKSLPMNARQSISGLNQTDVLKILGIAGLNEIETIVFCSFCIRLIKGEVGWLHFNVAKYLNVQLLMGVREAHLPAIVQSFLTIESFGGNATPLSFPNGILAAGLSEFAPRAAIAHGIQAVMQGNNAGLALARPAFRSLGLPDQTGSVDFEHVSQTAKNLNIPMAVSFAGVRSQDAFLHKVEEVEEASTKVLGQPSGDTEHYIFKAADVLSLVPSVRIHVFQNATYSVDCRRLGRTEFYVFDNEERCVTDLSLGANPFIDKEIINLDFPICILDDQFSGGMSICHFLLDQITRIKLYDKVAPLDAKYFIVSGYSYYREIIKKLGLSDRFFIPNERRVSIKSRSIFFSSNVKADLRHPAHLCSAWAIDFLRDRLGIKGKTNRHRKIFISRADAKGRAIINSQEIFGVLMEFKYEIIELAKLPVDEQIEVFMNASHVVGVHGAGLTNIIFSDPGCKVLEILPPFVATQAYWRLSTQLGQKYFSLIADDPVLPRPDYKNWTHSYVHNSRDVVVPPDRLRRILHSMELPSID